MKCVFPLFIIPLLSVLRGPTTRKIFSLFSHNRNPKGKIMRENDVMNHDRALIMVVLFVIHRPAASAVARPPSTTVAPSSAAPSSLNARIRLRGAALVPDVADLGWKGRRRWRKGDCERIRRHRPPGCGQERTHTFRIDDR